MKRTMFFILVYGLGLGGMVLTAQSNQGKVMYVAVKQANLKSSTGFFAASKGQIEYGAPVTVVQEKGKWAEIRSKNSPAKAGWITLSSLTSKRITASSGSAQASEIALAGKGFNAEVEAAYRKETGSGYAAVDKLESQSVSNEELRQFIREGRLSEGE
jgi:SH3-like domain-containing protein